MISFNVVPISLAAGLAYALMALTVWSLLRRTPQAPAVRLWSLGSGLGGVGMMLIASRGVLSDLVGYGLSASLIGAAVAVQVLSLRVHLARPPRAPVLAVLWLLAACVNLATAASGDLALHVTLSCAMLAVAAAVLAWHARQAALQSRLRSAALVAWSYTALALVLLMRSLVVGLGWSVLQHPMAGLDFAVLHVTAALAALYGSLGFVGMVLDLTRRSEAGAREAQVAERVRREAAESHAQALTQLLAQRDALATEREGLLQLLAHEIRQPLHNAKGALRAATLALQSPQPASVSHVAERLARAEGVLGGVRSVLDNTLAAATLLSRSAPLMLQEVDLRFLIELTLADLDDDQRARVTLHWQTDQRQAEVEPGLVRLALRNLLLNAFAHGGPSVAVQLRVLEQLQPPGVVLCVEDDGPGLPAAAAAPLDGEGRRPGMGLHIVRQVLALHGGRLDLQPVATSGLQARMVLPLPAG